MNSLRLFGMNASLDFAKEVADHLDVELTKHHEKYFSDREPYVHSEDNVRGCDVYVIQSLYTDENESVNDKFTKLLFFIGSLKDASAQRVTAIIPYLSFGRQDRKTESRAPIHTKYVAELFEAVGTNRLLTMDVHSLGAFQNAFRIQTDNLEAKNLQVNFLAKHFKGREDLIIISPDSGGLGRAKRFRNKISQKIKKEVGIGCLDKTRVDTDVQAGIIISDMDIEGKTAVIVDDMIASGGTIFKCKKAIEVHGGKLWGVFATHGLFVGNINENLSSIDRVIITDTIKPKLNEENTKKLQIISSTKIFAQAIRRIHDQGGSISELLK